MREKTRGTGGEMGPGKAPSGGGEGLAWGTSWSFRRM